MKIAATADLHCTTDSRGRIARLLKNAEPAEVLVLAGDLTNSGTTAEMEVLLEELRRVSIPIVVVMGNHDHQSEEAHFLVEMMRREGIHVLDGSSCRIGKVDFVGTKGFCGGFGRLLVQPFGEQALKDFIRTGIDEVVRMQREMETLRGPHKVAVLHYSPVRETLEGEEPELFPFLGSSRMGDALDAFHMDIVFHGHAHHGSPVGHTRMNIPVHNVSRFVQQRAGRSGVALLSVG